jgi:hypothetical protein
MTAPFLSKHWNTGQYQDPQSFCEPLYSPVRISRCSARVAVQRNMPCGNICITVYVETASRDEYQDLVSSYIMVMKRTRRMPRQSYKIGPSSPLHVSPEFKVTNLRQALSKMNSKFLNLEYNIIIRMACMRITPHYVWEQPVAQKLPVIECEASCTMHARV